MRFLFICLAVCFFPNLALPLNTFESRTLEPISLSVGEQKIIQIPGIIRFSIQQERKRPIVRSVRQTPLHEDQILLQGLRTGVADLWVWKSDGSSDFRSVFVGARRFGNLATPSALDRNGAPRLAPIPLSQGHSEILTFEVYLLEVVRNQIQRLGIEWPESFAFSLKARALSPETPLDAWVQLMESEGWGKILSKPEISLHIPGEAELFSGSEIPVPIRTRERAGVEWRKVGLGLKLRALESNQSWVRLEIQTESSQITPEISVGGIPGVSSNRMNTQIDAKTHQPILLSGLLQERTAEAERGLPGLQQIPWIGRLFRSESDLNERRELVVLLKPRPASAAHSTEKPLTQAPKGKAPRPRNSLSTAEEMRVRLHPDFPWNAFEDTHVKGGAR